MANGFYTFEYILWVCIYVLVSQCFSHWLRTVSIQLSFPSHMTIINRNALKKLIVYKNIPTHQIKKTYSKTEKSLTTITTALKFKDHNYMTYWYINSYNHLFTQYILHHTLIFKNGKISLLPLTRYCSAA